MVTRGDVWWATFEAPLGSEPGFRHPVLVLQADEFNRSSINTLIVAMITSNLKRAHQPGNILVKRRESGLPKDSVVNVSQINTIDRAQLVERTRRLTPATLSEVADGVRLVLGL